MRHGRIALVVGLALLAWPAAAAAQGLGDTAARERARRAKETATGKAEPARVFTNDDLNEGRPPGAEVTSGEAEGTSGAYNAPPAGSSPSDERQVSSKESGAPDGSGEPGDDRASRERPYLDAITNAQVRVSQIESRIKALGDKLNPMSGSFIYGAGGSNSANEEAQVRSELTQAEGELTQARQELARANQALQDARQGRSTKE
jgi:hypothetical protein